MSFISKTVRDRVISGKLWTPQITKDYFFRISEKVRHILAIILNFGRNGKYHLSQKP